MRKKFLTNAVVLTLAFIMGMIFAPEPIQRVQAANVDVAERVISKSINGNPMLGFDENGEQIYGGDPSILVDGDTVYAYVGHDTSTGNNYVIPEYMCYSSKDMVNWKYEGVIMRMTDVSWGDNNSAWAGQVAKHNGTYYLYYCSWNNQDNGKQSIGVAVSDSPTGTFKDIGHALIKGSVTTDEIHTWNDIDPTMWIETDEDGEERRYLAWGNDKLYVCELNEDMVSVKDQNNNKILDMGDIVSANDSVIAELGFTEAPYLYRQQDENGKYYGKYYIFYAQGWREKMAYCTTGDPMSGEWEYRGELMPPAATSNTNHPAVFDFKGKTYFVYHNGSLAGGSGFRRVACVEEFTLNADGSIDPIPETAVGISGTSSQIFNVYNEPIAHEKFRNSGDDGDYPLVADVGFSNTAAAEDAVWVVGSGKADKEKDAYVSIQANNKPGLYLKAEGNNVVLTQDVDASTNTAKAMTFRTLKGFAGYGVTFESVAYPGMYMTCDADNLTLSDGSDTLSVTFRMDGLERPKAIHALKQSRYFTQGDKFNVNDITATVYYDDGSKKVVTNYTTNASSFDMSKEGTKSLRISYTESGVTLTHNIQIMVYAKEEEPVTPVVPEVPKKGKTYTVGNLKYKVTKSASKNGEVAATAPTSKTRKTITIPATVKLNGYTFKVTSIQKNAFKSNKNLKTITIGKNISSIGNNAFKSIKNNAVFRINKAQYNKIKKLLTTKTGYKKTMTLKKI